MKNLILIKLGGSVITDKGKPFTAWEEIIRRLAREIKEARRDLKNTQIILAHGGGSFSHVPAAKYKTAEGIINKNSVWGLSVTADAAIQINRIVVKNFLKEGLSVFSFAPASFEFAKSKKEKKIFLEPIIEALRIGLIPVVYGDVILDEENGFCIFSAEKTLTVLAKYLRKEYKIKKIIECGDTDGVYDGKGKTISKITPNNFKGVKRWITGSRKVDVTGGMIHKVEESLNLAQNYKIPTVIINGNKKGNLLGVMLGNKVIATTIRVI